MLISSIWDYTKEDDDKIQKLSIIIIISCLEGGWIRALCPVFLHLQDLLEAAIQLRLNREMKLGPSGWKPSTLQLALQIVHIDINVWLTSGYLTICNFWPI